MKIPFSIGLLAIGSAAFAQTTPPAVTLKEVTVTGNPLGSSDLVAPAAQLSGTNLLLRSQTTVGETLSGTPGVSSTYFGPNASRPTIRGLEGDRIRILNNSGASTDVSSLSFDHAMAADPITIERIEVLRGPAALLYGGSAIGGVVNLIDNRIPQAPQTGISGRADLGFATANRERGGGVLLEGGNGRVVLHADAFSRRTSDVRVPVDLACTQDGVTRVQRRICNSAGETRGGAVGGSVFFDRGYVGASASTYRNDYGAVAEDEVTIGMRSNRYAVEGELRDLGVIASLKAQASRTDYRHTEFEAGAPGTLFRNEGDDLRIEARHRKFGSLDGVIGVQVDRNDFSADGAEAFAPYSRTRQKALFAYEELGLSWGKLTFGARAENVEVTSFGNPVVARFATGTREFSPTSFAAGVLWNVAPGWQLTSNLAATQRAPKDYELFANGPHVATGAWEVGDPALGVERSRNVDVGVQWRQGPNAFRANAFRNRFSNYISLESTGNVIVDEEEGEEIPEFAYRPVRARFHGLEASGTARLLDGPQTVDLELRTDIVRAKNADTGEPLPRIAPWRAGATLAWARGAWGARLGFDHFAAQRRVPAGNLPAAAYTLWNAAVTYRMEVRESTLLWYARLDNATDKLAYSATSILTQTAPGKAPLPGRSVKIGLQVNF